MEVSNEAILRFHRLLCSMEESIGKHIQKYLRYKGISNKSAGDSIGLSESAFEKNLMKNDILISRLFKLSCHAGKNFLEFYYDKEPLATFREEELLKWTEKMENLEKTVQLKEELIKEKDQVIVLQNKLIAELEEKLGKKQ